MAFWIKAKQKNWSLPVIILAGLLCLACLISIIDRFMPIYQFQYTETRVKFVQSQIIKYNYDTLEDKNIDNAKIITSTVEKVVDNNLATNKKDILFQHNTLVIIFKQPIYYSSPKLNSFGYPFPSYDFVLMSKRAFIMEINGEIKAPMFELYFPALKMD
jgi:hypothetical protein